MKIIKPKKLKKGNKIGIIAVSGRIKEYENIEMASKLFQDEGYKVVISDTCKTSHRYMAGNNDDDCLNTLYSFFEDSSIDAILCARGGYGTLRYINKIDWNIIKNNPKIFAGYSDITILLNMIFKKTGMITFHSPMANGDFSNKIEPYTKMNFFNTLKNKTQFIKAENMSLSVKGIAEGLLWGGNLSSLVSLCGIDFIPDENLILFLEDLNEPTYKVDKMLTQLFNIDKIKRNIKGIAFGEFKDIENKKELNEVFKELSETLNIPICDGFKITHNKIKDTIPIGAMSVLNTETGIIEIKDSYMNEIGDEPI